MQEHPSSEQLNLYERRVLAPDDFLSVHRHVVACPVCSAACNAPGRIEADRATLVTALLPDPLDQPYHLTSAEVTGYVNENLDDVALEAAASHLEVCDDCIQAIEAARAVSGKKQDFLVQPSAGFMASIRAWGRPVQFASVVLLVLGLIAIGVVFMRSREEQPGQPAKVESASVNPMPAASPATPSPDQSATTRNDRPNAKPSLPADISPEAKGLASISPSAHEAVVSALTTQRIERPQVLAALRGASEGLRGGTADGVPFPLLSPVGQVVQDRNPTFSWKPLDGASRYIVTVADDKLNEVATSESLTRTQWRVRIALKRGGVYSWQVTAFKDAHEIVSPVMPAPQVRFMILDQTRAEELRKVKQSLPKYHIGLGVLYARAGLIDEAEQELQAELKANPDSSVARSLLESVRAMRE